jgi:hypothetical protein
MDLMGLAGMTGRVSIAGWLVATTDPNDDSLSVWLEWLDAPATIPSGATYEMSYTLTATPPSTVPEPATLALLAAGAVALAGRSRAKER